MEQRDEKLDLIRGVSALLVLAGHARNFVMVDSTNVAAPNLFTKLFYLLTSVHHQAVMVFFVLSGYFVGGSVLNALAKQRFTWIEYLISRLSRLWMVLIPALFLTMIIDFFGTKLTPDAYAGSLYHLYVSGPSLPEPAEWGVLVFLANALFLQEWMSPIYGTNGPLWSLAYEFWYYILFPLVIVGGMSKKQSSAAQMISLVLFGLLSFLLPPELVRSGLIWLMGVAVWKISRSPWIAKNAAHWWWNLIGGALFFSSVVGAKAGLLIYSDYVVGAAFALWMPSLLGTWKKKGWLRSGSFALSEISFSLYIIHFPIMFFVVSYFIKGVMYQPQFLGLCLFAGLILLSIVLTTAFWWCFESRTPWLRKLMRNILQKPHKQN